MANCEIVFDVSAESYKKIFKPLNFLILDVEGSARDSMLSWDDRNLE